MQDLDDITSKLRTKLSCGVSTPAHHTSNLNRVAEFEPSSTSMQGQYPLTSTQSDLTFDLPRSQGDTPRDDLVNTGSHGAESTRTGGDSGTYSVEQSNEKYDDSAPVSQRSASDRLDTLRSGTTPRDLLDSGIPQTNNNSNSEEPEQSVWMTKSLGESLEKKDEYSESGGFSFRRSPRDSVHTPRDMYSPRDNFHMSNGVDHATKEAKTVKDLEQVLHDNLTGNVQQHLDNARRLLAEAKESRNVDQKQMSIIQEYSENDKSDSDGEDENRYYHRYRDLLDNEDNVSDNDKDDDNEEEEGEVIIPRRINDVSGKFSPTGEIIVLSDSFKESVPYGVSSSYSDQKTVNDLFQTAPKGKTVPKETSGETEVVLEDLDSEDESEPNKDAQVHMANQDEIVFDEKDSWLSDSDKETEGNLMACNRYLSSHGHSVKPKHCQRQDSDTGYSSRDNVSESYLTPSAGGTNSETDMSRLQEPEHWLDQRENGEDPVFVDKAKGRLLANVELESTGGSFGLRYDSGGASRISSAGSRHTRKSSEQSVTESFDEREEQDYLKQELEPIHSARETTSIHSSSGEVNLPPGENDFEEIVMGVAYDKQTVHFDRTGSESERSENSEMNSARIGTENVFSCQGLGNALGEGTRKSSRVPNFFMPVQHLEESMRTLQVVTNKVSWKIYYIYFILKV